MKFAVPPLRKAIFDSYPRKWAVVVVVAHLWWIKRCAPFKLLHTPIYELGETCLSENVISISYVRLNVGSTFQCRRRRRIFAVGPGRVGSLRRACVHVGEFDCLGGSCGCP